MHFALLFLNNQYIPSEISYIALPRVSLGVGASKQSGFEVYYFNKELEGGMIGVLMRDF